MKTIMTTLALILALGAGLALADELPAAAQKIWAPAGDEVGTENHATLTGVNNDAHGDAARAAEDESIKGETMGLGLFGWFLQKDNGHRLAVRGLLGNTEGGGLGGDLALKSSAPGTYRAVVTYQAHDLFYDRDSEQRGPVFPTVVPPQLTFTPHIDWRRGRVDLNYHMSSVLDLRVGADDLRREGRKSSLLGQGPPNVQTMDTQMAEVWLGGTAKLGQVGADLELKYFRSDDDRAYQGGHVYADERDRYSASLDASYDVNARTRVIAAGRMSRIEHTGAESGIIGAGDTDGDSDSAAYQLGVITRLGQATTLRASARFDSHSTEAAVHDGSDVLVGSERERDRQQYAMVLGNTSLPRTRVQLRYRYSSGDETETITQGMLPNNPAAGLQPLESETTRQDLSLRVRTRLSRTLKLRADLRYTGQEVDETQAWDTTDDLWYGTLGDHERSRTSYRLSLQAKAARNLPVDLGLRGYTQSFKRTEGDEVETTADMMGLFLNANWLATSRLTVFGMVTYGQETYELDAAEPTPGFSAYNVDATTVRISPGATFTVSPELQLDGWYEGVIFEDQGDESGGLNKLETNRDRLSLRARWQAMEKMAITAGYARYELDENLWDDHIEHLWTLSAHTRF